MSSRQSTLCARSLAALKPSALRARRLSARSSGTLDLGGGAVRRHTRSRAAEQPVDRQAGGLAQDVPQRGLEPGDADTERSPGLEHVLEALDVRRVAPEHESSPGIAEPGVEAPEREPAGLADDAVVGGQARERELVSRLTVAGVRRQSLGGGKRDADVEQLESLDLHPLSFAAPPLPRSRWAPQLSREACPSPSLASSRQNRSAPGRQRSRSSWKREIARRPTQLPP